MMPICAFCRLCVRRTKSATADRFDVNDQGTSPKTGRSTGFSALNRTGAAW
jgi:hypothetical protein